MNSLRAMAFGRNTFRARLFKQIAFPFKPAIGLSPLSHGWRGDAGMVGGGLLCQECGKGRSAEILPSGTVSEI